MRPKRVEMKWLVLALALALAGVSSGCGFAKRVIAKDKMNQGVLKYNQGDNASAKDYFKSATEYVPNEAVAWLYYGATLVKDYKAQTGDQRDATANESLEIFKKALDLGKGNCDLEESAMAYIAAIYEDTEE